jgi:hypothetical protein
MYRVLMLLAFFSIVASAWLAGTQPTSVTAQAAGKPLPTPEKALYSSYKGIGIGSAMADVRAKLGNAKEASDAQDYYIVSDSEFVQVYYDPAKTVRAISITFTGKLESAPTAKAVFGEEVELNAEGGAFKLVRYPKAGYFISYTKAGGSDQMVMIAIQKM